MSYNYKSTYNNNNNKNPTYGTYDTSLDTNTTFVQAHPSEFRAVVQRLTGSSSSSSSSSTSFSRQGLENTVPFKLHERRKLEMIKLNNNNNNYQYDHGPMNNGLVVRAIGGNNIEMFSPVSPLDGLGLGLGSPSPRNNNITNMMNYEEEKERAIIAEKGFYLHNNNKSMDYRYNEPKLLPLFPLHSPRD
ncbi:hypothetical protein vseg_007159 [Gypsophila vaccaria]